MIRYTMWQELIGKQKPLKFFQIGNLIERIGYKGWMSWKSKREKEKRVLKEEEPETSAHEPEFVGSY